MWKYWSEQLNFGGLESRKISVFFPSLPCSCLPYISASPRPCSSSLAHLLLPARLPACLPAGYLQTQLIFCLATLTRACEDLRHTCGCLPAYLCVLHHWRLYKVPACVCLHVWEHKKASPKHVKYLLNHRGLRHMCIYEPGHICMCKCPHIDFPHRFPCAASKECMSV